MAFIVMDRVPVKEAEGKMKKRGVLNQSLSNALAGLGHGDGFLLCDAGFPIPKGVERIDLALSFGIPDMEQCLDAILDEIIVQKIIIAKEMKKTNIEGYTFVDNLFKKQEKEEISQRELAKKAEKVKFIVRCGEVRYYSNIYLEAASGVEELKRELNIEKDEMI